MAFHYKRGDRQQAKVLVFNILVLVLMWMTLRHFDNGTSEYAQLIQVSNYAGALVGVVLAFLSLMLWKRNRNFIIDLSPATLTVNHPSSHLWSWSIAPQTITEIEHCIDLNSYTAIYLHTDDGKKWQLCQNYNYSRKGLYLALAKINPRIKMPDNPNRFRRVK